MKPLVVGVIVAWSCAARADIPNGVAQRLVRFVFEGCDYLTANAPEPHKPEPPDKKLAAHFGHIVKSQKRGIGLEYVLKTRGFEGWEVSYFFREIELKFPPSVAITMGDLQRFLGADEAPDVDYAVSMKSGGANVDVEERAFKTNREDLCSITVRAEANRDKGPARRVFSLLFVD